MENILTQIPSSALGWFAAMLGTLGGVVWIFKSIRSADLELLRQTNQDLRNAHKDNQEKILNLEIEVSNLRKEMDALKANNKTLETLVSNALTDYFAKYPRRAEELAIKVTQ